MLMGDLLSVVQHRLPIKIVIFNNGALAFVELELKAAGILGEGTELVNPDFAKLAEVVGIKGVRVDRPGDLVESLRTAFAYPGPVVVDVKVNRQELSMPPTITLDQAAGFNLYAFKAIINHRGNEILDMAKTNLRQVLTSLLPGASSSAE
jgi:pyruvate dehydrogenase (quinone)